MEWTDAIREGIEMAINEADVLGIRLDPAGAWCDLLLHVLALPEKGPLDPDRRRILRLTNPGEIRVVLRRVQPSGNENELLFLRDLDAVEEFFSSLAWSGGMYGWKFFDDPSLTADWPAEPNLVLRLRSEPATHSIYWFNECARVEGEGPVGLCIEGTVTFEELAVLRADERPQPLNEFIGDGRRCWEALHSDDIRMSGDAQRAAREGTPSWRPYETLSVTVPGGSADPAAG